MLLLKILDISTSISRKTRQSHDWSWAILVTENPSYWKSGRLKILAELTKNSDYGFQKTLLNFTITNSYHYPRTLIIIQASVELCLIFQSSTNLHVRNSGFVLHCYSSLPDKTTWHPKVSRDNLRYREECDRQSWCMRIDKFENIKI